MKMTPQLSKNKQLLIDFVKSQPGQTAADYQALMDATADDRGLNGRMLKVDSALSLLLKQGYLKRENGGGYADPYTWFTLDRPTPAVVLPEPLPRPRRVHGATLEIKFSLTLPSGQKLSLSQDDAKAIFHILKGTFQ